jgi:hypothetical protein
MMSADADGGRGFGFTSKATAGDLKANLDRSEGRSLFRWDAVALRREIRGLCGVFLR